MGTIERTNGRSQSKATRALAVSASATSTLCSLKWRFPFDQLEIVQRDLRGSAGRSDIQQES